MLVAVKMKMRRSLVAWMTVWKTEWQKTTEILNTERRQGRKWLDQSNDVSIEFAAQWVITDVPYWTYTWASLLPRTRNMWRSTPSMLGEDCLIRVRFWADLFCCFVFSHRGLWKKTVLPLHSQLWTLHMHQLHWWKCFDKKN